VRAARFSIPAVAAPKTKSVLAAHSACPRGKVQVRYNSKKKQSCLNLCGTLFFDLAGIRERVLSVSAENVVEQTHSFDTSAESQCHVHVCSFNQSAPSAGSAGCAPCVPPPDPSYGMAKSPRVYRVRLRGKTTAVEAQRRQQAHLERVQQFCNNGIDTIACPIYSIAPRIPPGWGQRVIAKRVALAVAFIVVLLRCWVVGSRSCGVLRLLDCIVLGLLGSRLLGMCVAGWRLRPLWIQGGC
jgi:hypothetical protein